MTTPKAAAAYLANHEWQMEGKRNAVFNPHDKPFEDLPIIYGFNNGGSRDWWHAQLLAEDGTALGSHICSSEGYMPHDLGILEGTRPDRHKHFQAHYPEGYRMVFVPGDTPFEHEGLMAAYEKNQEKRKKAEPDDD